MSSATFKHDANKQKWEETEFPLVCETCLGDNPYIRMTKENHGKKCKICEIPFTVFAWQAGTKGRLKRVEICQNCARAKNVCQVCIFDLQYGLPVQLRDRILAEEGSASAITAVPQSDANRSWYTAQQTRALERGEVGATPNDVAHYKLAEVARMQPRYERNLPKLCSFFARGECNRGSTCPFRHEMPRDRNDPLSKQNTKDRFYGTTDPVADKMVGRIKSREAKKKEELGEIDETGSTVFVGWDTKESLLPVTEMDIRDKFYSFGEIAGVRMNANKGAFVEYTLRAAADLAINAMNKKEIGGRTCFTNWARESKRGDFGRSPLDEMSDEGNGIPSGPIRPMAPPGMNSSASDSAGPSPILPPTLPSGFAPVRAPAPIVFDTSTRTNAQSGNISAMGVPRPSDVPRPGGGVIRRAGGRLGAPASKPYYPSQDPGRLGSHTQR